MRKTIGILAHVDAGKTTLSEAVLYHGKAIRAKGRVDHRDSFLDADAVEKQRGITVFSGQAAFSLATINPVVSTSNFENQIKVTLPANSTITLQLFTTIAGTAILVSGGAGASLTIIRLS